MQKFNIEFTEMEIDLVVRALARFMTVEQNAEMQLIPRIIADARAQLNTDEGIATKPEDNVTLEKPIKVEEEISVSLHNPSEEGEIDHELIARTQAIMKGGARKGGRPKGVKNKPK